MICTHIQGENGEFVFCTPKRCFCTLPVSINYNKIRDTLNQGKYKVLQTEVLKTSVR
jgi:hypothetical protein